MNCPIEPFEEKELRVKLQNSITSVQKHVQKPITIDYIKLRPYFGWVNADTIKKTLKTLLNGQSHQPEVPALTFQEEMKLWPQIPYSLIPQLLTMCHDGPNLHQQRFLGL